MQTLFIIPARGGSKGIPQKNIKHLANKPLIHYAIDNARHFTNDEHICVSSDNEQIIDTVESYGLKVPFIRPDDLATDTATTNEVLLHAIQYYESQGKHYENIVLLQPTSPFRTIQNIREALALYHKNIDMVVSVFETEANPYYLLVEEDQDGFLQKSKTLPQSITRRQDVPKVWQYNGAIYVINVNSLKKYQQISNFEKVTKYEMDKLHSLDIDTPLDWAYAEFLLEKHFVVL